MLMCIIVSKEETSMQSKKFNDKSNVIGQTVRKYRMQKGYTQEQLCQQLDLLGLNLYHSDIHLIENNKRIVKDYEAFAFAKIFGITLNELYIEAYKDFS